MWTRWKVCDACESARATVETESGFFLCEECETVVVVAFQEFELPVASPIGDWKGPPPVADANRLR
jgi:hypothetical protein